MAIPLHMGVDPDHTLDDGPLKGMGGQHEAEHRGVYCILVNRSN